jgi:pyruvate,water dikinase
MSASIVAQGLFDRLASLSATAGLPDLHLELSTGYGGLEELEMVAALHRVAHDGASLARFLAVYGSRAVSEMELSTPSWREDPGIVERLVQKYRDAPERVRPEVRMRASAAARVDAERRLLAALSPARRVSARLLLWMAQRHIPLREVGKATLSKAMDGGRVAVRSRGRELVAAGHLDTEEDVFYLTVQEILTEPPTDARGLIKHRRALRVEYEKIDVPKVWVGNPEPVIPEIPAADRVTQLSGIGAAFGVVEGRARVVLDADGCDELEADEILVCRTTDPSWAAAFHLVSATVIDIGGSASHGAIVSREMGLPCVINTGNGTKVLRTGDLLRVDGNSGTVTVLEPAV